MPSPLEYDAFISYSHLQDDVRGPVIQSELQRFAKPWYKLRALRIFIDKADLVANPALWGSIEAALRSSRWFIYLASRDAAESEWVDREVHWWVTHRSAETIIIVATDSGMAWDGDGRDWVTAAPVPPSLRGVFAEEPLWIDLRNLEASGHGPTVPVDRIAAVAAPIRGIPKDLLIGQHLQEHRRAMRLAQSAVAGLATLTALAVVASVIAVRQRNSAIAQSRTAQSEQLAAEATKYSATNAPVSMLLSAASYELAPTAEARTVLMQESNQPLGRLLSAGASAVNGVAYSANGKSLAAANATGGITLWNTETWQRKNLRFGKADITAIALNKDGEYLVAGDSAGDLSIWDTQTRKEIESAAGKNKNSVESIAFSDNGNYLAIGFANGYSVIEDQATGQVVTLKEGYRVAAAATSLDLSRC